MPPKALYSKVSVEPTGTRLYLHSVYNNSYTDSRYVRVRVISYCVTCSFSLVHRLGVFGYPDGSVGAAIVAVVLIHTVIAGYVYVAWKDGPSTTVTFKQD